MNNTVLNACSRCKWLRTKMDQLPCKDCHGHSLYEPINKEKKKEINHKWCNTCEYRVSEERCQGCAIRDEFGNLKDLSNYKEEKMEEIIIKEKDNINPDHYKSETSLECIEAMEIIFGRDAVIDFCTCNAWKYIWRWKHKNGHEDLKKSAWYLTHAFDMVSSDDKRFNTLKGMVNYVARQGISVKKESKDG